MQAPYSLLLYNDFDPERGALVMFRAEIALSGRISGNFGDLVTSSTGC